MRSVDVQSFFWGMGVALILLLACVSKDVVFETDSIDLSVLSFHRSSTVRSAAWYDFNQQRE